MGLQCVEAWQSSAGILLSMQLFWMSGICQLFFAIKKTKCMSFQLASSSFDHPSIATDMGPSKIGT